MKEKSFAEMTAEELANWIQRHNLNIGYTICRDRISYMIKLSWDGDDGVNFQFVPAEPGALARWFEGIFSQCP